MIWKNEGFAMETFPEGEKERNQAAGGALL